MSQLYSALRPFLRQIDNVKNEKHFLCKEEDITVDRFFKRSPINGLVTPKLQSDATLLSDARMVFGAVVDKYPRSEQRLNDRAIIVENAKFLQSIVKM